MNNDKYENMDIVDVVRERMRIKSQISSLIIATDINDLPTLSDTSEWKKLNSEKSLLEDELYLRGAYNERHIDIYEKSLKEGGSYIMNNQNYEIRDQLVQDVEQDWNVMWNELELSTQLVRATYLMVNGMAILFIVISLLIYLPLRALKKC